MDRNVTPTMKFFLFLLFIAATLNTHGPSAQADEFTWTWMKGASEKGQRSVYGTLGVPDPDNTPGGRLSSVSWTDAEGNLWLFGGIGYVDPYNDTTQRLNDLWKYNPATGDWTWMKGSSNGNQSGVYGTLGVPDPANTPGGRINATTWTDTEGNLWLFGGWGLDAEGRGGNLNDLWKYNLATGNWTWMKGSSLRNQPGISGTLGVPSEENTPYGRKLAVSWVDADGSLWLFGGDGIDADHISTQFNDLWKYDPATGNWTWMNGATDSTEPAVFGTLGVPDPNNTPGGRFGSVAWTGLDGSLWLFGGYREFLNTLNDLWKYDSISGNWTWMKGSSTSNTFGTYGTLGVPDEANTPGARQMAVAWTDPDGSLWLFGGVGYAATEGGHLNDLWNYDIATGNWTWMQGSSLQDQSGVYGTLGLPVPNNSPGSRYDATSWTDAEGAFWVFGGTGYDIVGFYSYPLNDLWRGEMVVNKNAVNLWQIYQ